jgi:23S rRNA (cytidine1920-2'-O)/16S rRNA (cytidine1409-2'-O)-methyltransferase
VTRVRIDRLLAERGLYGSRSAAATGVLAGEVLVGPGRRRARKPGELVEAGAEVAVQGGPAYVSRGGRKLERALDVLGIDPAGRDCLDAGASTGGFTDCLLQRGAARVTCVDVAYGELAWRLRGDERVTVMERTNARALEPGQLPYAPELIVCDLSFIGLGKVLPALAGCLKPDGDLLALVKPQFELGRNRVGKGGVVRDAADRRDALLGAARDAEAAGLRFRGFAGSGLPGPKGNRETFLWCDRGPDRVSDPERAAWEVEP